MKRQWETEELVEHWTLDVEDRTLLGNKTGATRLGFAILLKFFRREGRFPQREHQLVGASNHSLDTAQRAEARDEWDTVAKAFNALTEEQRQVLMGWLILVFKMAS